MAQLKRARLQDAIDRGYDDANAGRLTTLESEAELDAFLASL